MNKSYLSGLAVVLFLILLAFLIFKPVIIKSDISISINPISNQDFLTQADTGLIAWSESQINKDKPYYLYKQKDQSVFYISFSDKKQRLSGVTLTKDNLYLTTIQSDIILDHNYYQLFLHGVNPSQIFINDELVYEK